MQRLSSLGDGRSRLRLAVFPCVYLPSSKLLNVPSLLFMSILSKKKKSEILVSSKFCSNTPLISYVSFCKDCKHEAALIGGQLPRSRVEGKELSKGILIATYLSVLNFLSICFVLTKQDIYTSLFSCVLVDTLNVIINIPNKKLLTQK